MAKVVFVSLYNKEAIGPCYVSSYLKKNGHQSSIVFLKKYCQIRKSKINADSAGDYHTMIDNCGRDLVLAYNAPINNQEINLFIDLIARLEPDLIGFSLTSVILKTAIEVSGVIKARFKGIPIVWGGIEPTIDPENCLNYADIVCLGEGEEAILELAEALDQGKAYLGIPNLWLKHEGKIIKNPVRPLIQDLDSLPFPDFGFEDKYLIDNGQLFQGKDLSIALSEGQYETITSRGCPFSCTYCCNGQLKALYPKQKYLRRRSVGNVIEELKLVKKERNPYYIQFHDDIFTFNKAWIKEFADLYQREINLPFWCNVHPRFTKEEVIITLKNAGLHGMTCGIQSGSEHVANEIYHRRVANQDVANCAKLLHRLGIKYNFDLITNNPLETEDDCREALDFLLSLPRPVLNNGISKLSFFPGTEIEKMLEAEKIDKKVDEKRYAFYNKLYLITQFRLPRRFIGYMGRNQVLRENPGLLSVFFIPNRAKEAIKDSAKKIIPRELWLRVKKYF